MCTYWAGFNNNIANLIARLSLLVKLITHRVDLVLEILLLRLQRLTLLEVV